MDTVLRVERQKSSGRTPNRHSFAFDMISPAAGENIRLTEPLLAFNMSA
jgi:hypothetical protein